jgi:hypothetical protein
MGTERETLVVWRCPTCGIGEVTEPGDYPPGGPAICPHPAAGYESRVVVPFSELEDERHHADDLVALVERVGEVKTPGDIRGVGWWLHAGEVLQRHRERRSSGDST